MNHLAKLKHLKNRYFALRHGESQANIESFIVSDHELGAQAYGLSERGKQQVEKAVRGNQVLDNKTLIFSSDFKRTLETAAIAQEILDVDSITPGEVLRERFFGDFNQTPHKNYWKIWEADALDSSHRKWNVESLEAVLARTTKFILDLEDQYDGKKILLVSHGDPLQILQTGFLKVPASEHRNLKKLKTGEIRELELPRG